MKPLNLDLSGQPFGRLVALERIRREGRNYWLCLCSCGQLTEVLQALLRNGRTRSCGCMRREAGRDVARKYPKTGLKAAHRLEVFEKRRNWTPKRRARYSRMMVKRWKNGNYRAKVESGHARYERDKNKPRKRFAKWRTTKKRPMTAELRERHRQNSIRWHAEKKFRRQNEVLNMAFNAAMNLTCGLLKMTDDLITQRLAVQSIV